MHDRFGALERLSPILEAVMGVGLAQGWGRFQKAAPDAMHRVAQRPVLQARNRAAMLEARD